MKHFGLIGKPLGHSFSEQYFTQKFNTENIDATYTLIELHELVNLDFIAKHKLDGFNVTIPYKESIIPFLDELSVEARSIGAVNCVSLKDGRLIGYNTDAFGFENSLRTMFDRHPKNAIVLGSGGSSKAVQYVLKAMDIGYKLVSRSGDLNYKNLHAAHIAEAELIVNTTPLGMWPNVKTCPDIPFEAIGTKHFAFDLVYNPEETLFLKKASLAGAVVKNGMEMLIAQAKQSWENWTAANLI